MFCLLALQWPRPFCLVCLALYQMQFYLSLGRLLPSLLPYLTVSPESRGEVVQL
jgi:hypothetical protein